MIRRFRLTKEQIAQVKKSPCPLATPFVPATCEGKRCMFWSANPYQPCGLFKDSGEGTDVASSIHR